MSKKSALSSYDYHSVLHGRVHNVGAGGVDKNGRLFVYGEVLISSKRFMQFIKRTDRAVGNAP